MMPTSVSHITQSLKLSITAYHYSGSQRLITVCLKSLTNMIPACQRSLSRRMNHHTDLKACSEIAYQQNGDVHGVSYICDGEEGWTSVIGKRRKYKVPTHLLRLRAPPHVRATLPSTDSSSDSDSSGSDCPLPWKTRFKCNNRLHLHLDSCYFKNSFQT